MVLYPVIMVLSCLMKPQENNSTVTSKPVVSPNLDQNIHTPLLTPFFDPTDFIRITARYCTLCLGEAYGWTTVLSPTGKDRALTSPDFFSALAQTDP